jgi:GDP-4-dehydro-6-deoxy-D-mannose reductase
VKILITGATGFVGSHLCEYLAPQGDEVHGTFVFDDELDIFPSAMRDSVRLHRCDLREADQMRAVVNTVRPDRIYHLAAISSVQRSWEGREKVLRINLFGGLNLLEAMREYCPDSRALMISSGEVYGKVPESAQPISESLPLRPINPYAASKAAQEMFCYQYIHTYQLPVVMVRPFNHSGPRQALNFVCPDFAHQIAEIEQGLRPPLMAVGNLEARRDFCDVRDIVRAYHLAIEHCPAGTPLNIASGRAWAIQDVLDTLLQLSTVSIQVRKDPERMRPADVALMLGDAAQFAHHTGWRAEIDFAHTLESVLDYWRQRVKSG